MLIERLLNRECPHLMTPSTEPHRRAPEQRREEILDAAVRLFCEKGYEGTTIRDIAREVGITEGLIYHYFPSKAALVAACWRQRSWHAFAMTMIREADNRPIEEVLYRLIRGHLAVLYEHGTEVRMHAAEMLRDGELAEISQRYNDQTQYAVASYLRRRQVLGHIRPDVDLGVVAECILGSTITFFVIHGRLPKDRWASLSERMAVQFSRLLTHGLIPHPETGA
jgi:AcrR family transcriptional regulator